MKKLTQCAVAILLLLTLTLPLASARAQGTAFTYQGSLNSGGGPANGLFDFRFRLDADPAGNTILDAVLTNSIGVTNGLFATTIDFGAGWFNGSNYWLEVDVKTNNFATYTALSPLQPLTPSPYAVFANTASNLSGTISAAQLSGPVTSANLSGTYGNAVTLNNAANQVSGSFAGDGTSVSNVNAAALNGLNATNFWQTGGNNVAAGQFVGSTNNQPLELWAGGNRAFRLEPNTSKSPNLLGGSLYNFVNAGVLGSSILGGGGLDPTFGNLTNQVAANSSTIGGGGGNFISASSGYGFSSVGGGVLNTLSGDFSSIGGGQYNLISGGYSTTVGGGSGNANSGQSSTIAGGRNNVITNASFGSATIGGGQNNSVNAPYATVGGGVGNSAQTGSYGATISGGVSNQTTNQYATVPGGNLNLAGGKYSFAAGQQAQAVHQGAFVWADSLNAPFTSTTNNQFLIRALGGVGIDTAVTPDNYFSINTNAYLFSHVLYLRGDLTSDHNHGLAYNGNLVTNFGTGNYQVDGPALWGFGGGLLGTRNGADHAALTWNTTGVTVNGTITGNGSGLTSLNAAQLTSGAVPLAQLPSAVVTNNESAVTLAGTFSGTGSGLTSLNASQLTSGTIPLARLPAAVLTNNQTAAVTLSNLTLNGGLTLPSAEAGGVPIGIKSGTSLLVFNDTNGNFFAGLDAGNTLVTGQANAGFGGGSLNSLTSGFDNLAGGYGSLRNLQTGFENTALGPNALAHLVGGSNNVAIGSSALFSSGSIVSPGGSGNIAIGRQAAQNYQYNESGNIIIGNDGVVLDENVIRIGTPGSHTSAFIAGVVTDVGGVQVGTNGTTMSFIQSGQAIMPSSSLVLTNFTVTFPHAFTSTPKVIASISGDPGFSTASDTFAMSIRAITTTTGFTVNVMRVDSASGWSQQLRVNWQAWQ